MYIHFNFNVLCFQLMNYLHSISKEIFGYLLVKKWATLFLLFMALCSSIVAQETPSPKKKNNFWRYFGIKPLDDTTSVQKDGLYFAPLVFYSPDTRWAFGAAGAYVFHINDKKNSLSQSRASNYRFAVNYTQNQQSDFWSEWSVFTKAERYYLKGEFRVRSFPDVFYGLGNTTQLSDREEYAYNLISFKLLGLKQLYRYFFFGLDYHFTRQYDFAYPKGQITTLNLTGNNGGTGSALGLASIYDDRDNVMNPYKGTYAEVSSYLYRTALGGTYNFDVINAEFRKYFKIMPKHIIAFQSKARIASGDVPLIDMSMVGGDDLLRSYARNRFRDKNMFGAQVEYRFPVIWRFGMTTFAGIGDVFNRTTDLNLKSLKYCLGGGLRFLMNSAERLNVRIDYGYGPDGGQYYVSFAEAF